MDHQHINFAVKIPRGKAFLTSSLPLMIFLAFDQTKRCTTVKHTQENSCRQLSVIVNPCRCECPDSCPAYVTHVPLPLDPGGTHSLSDHAGTCLVKARGYMPLIRFRGRVIYRKTCGTCAFSTFDHTMKWTMDG